MNRLAHVLRKVGKQIGFRAGLIAILAVMLALLAAVLAPLIPYDLSIKIGADAVDNILTILASSMLAVTTFSMTAMVTAFNGSAQNVTPRATQLLIEDSAAQNALSTFLGGFVFGIVGIIALSTGWYGSEGRVVLFVGTVLMIGWIVVVLLRWIQRLTNFGRMEDTIERVEAVTLDALERHAGPVLWCRREGSAIGGSTICAEGIGYVVHVDRDAIREAAGEAVEICAPPGSFVDPSTPLVRLDGTLDDGKAGRVREAFTLGKARDFREDPRFGFIVLSEIASRALSPAVNDPGSAIATLAAGHRLAHRLLARANTISSSADDVAWPIFADEMMEDLVRPVARDGAAMAEVGIRLQRLLGSIAREAEALAPAMRELSDYAMAQVDASTMIEADRARVRRARERAFPR